MAGTSASSFVFFDPSAKRWIRVRRGLGAAGVGLGLALAIFSVSLATSPRLPEVLLPAVPHLPNLAEVRSIIRGESTSPNVPFNPDGHATSAWPVGGPEAPLGAGPNAPLVFAYYVNWDRASLVSLRLNARKLSYLVAEWLILRNSQGDLEDESDPEVIRVTRAANLPILAMVTNFRQGWQGDAVHQLLNDAQARRQLVDNIYDALVEHQFVGVNIDFEQIPVTDRELLSLFMTELRTRLKPAGLLVTQSVSTDDPAYDLGRLAALNDYLIAMLYDEHYQSGVPGPIASLPWFLRELRSLASALPRERTVIGFGNYGYDWIIGGRGAAEVAFGDVMSAAARNRAEVRWNPATQTPVLRYRLEHVDHEVWFLDAVTAFNQVVAVSRAGFRGLALWRLGAEDPGLWTVVDRAGWPTPDVDPASLSRLAAHRSVKHYGQGEVLRIVERPREGSRRVWRDAGGYLAERYEGYPRICIVESHGKVPGNVIALTFDDGPDGRYTPQVLDILRDRGIPATFFVVGLNAERFPGLLRRMYAEGHEIGNHTYSHPDLTKISSERLRLELNATQRIIQHTLGVSTTLFRPPYRADSELQTPRELEPILEAQGLGYLTIGERIDPRDWQPGLTPDGVLAGVLTELDRGQVVILHDGGGDRSATVAALPGIIDYLRAQGYRFVRISALIGKRRDEVMPALAEPETRWAEVAGGALEVKSALQSVVWALFVTAICLTVVRSVAFGTLAIVQKRKVRRLEFNPAYGPPVSVIIAAHNETTVIVETIEAVLKNGYAGLEVLLVDDGSTDETADLVRERFVDDDRVRVYGQPRGGKAAALNTAVADARHDVLVAIDADTVLRSGTIEKLVRHFADPGVGAVSGNARVGNRRTWITRFQSLEYVCAFNLERRALDLLNAITVVPGAVGAWRKAAVLQAGGFTSDTLAEDTDLTLTIRRLGYRIRYEEEAVGHTEAPEDTKSLARQRFRWLFGTLQCAWKHRGAVFRRCAGSLGFVGLPSIWVFQVALTVLSPVADVVMLVAWLSGNWPIVLLYYVAFLGLEAATAVLAYSLEGVHRADLALLPLQRLYYRYLLLYVLGRALLGVMKGRVIAWDKLERRARLSLRTS